MSSRRDYNRRMYPPRNTPTHTGARRSWSDFLVEENETCGENQRKRPPQDIFCCGCSVFQFRFFLSSFYCAVAPRNTCAGDGSIMSHGVKWVDLRLCGRRRTRSIRQWYENATEQRVNHEPPGSERGS